MAKGDNRRNGAYGAHVKQSKSQGQRPLSYAQHGAISGYGKKKPQPGKGK